jgi:hypothetical protein
MLVRLTLPPAQVALLGAPYDAAERGTVFVFARNSSTGEWPVSKLVPGVDAVGPQVSVPVFQCE